MIRSFYLITEGTIINKQNWDISSISSNDSSEPMTSSDSDLSFSDGFCNGNEGKNCGTVIQVIKYI